ncbi:MAG TPA: cytochrome c biogenesis protein ResB [Opitutaceae bacterium]|nr:cytochrome c biogenesis protein ResB [Opitutaceae bacterium]
MNPLAKPFVQFFTSLRVTVILLALSLVLVFLATLDQVNLGVWAVQQKYFRSLFVMVHVPGTPVSVPVFPGGYLIGGLLLVNLAAAHAYRFRLGWRKAGIWLAHLGLILLLLGELFTGLWQRDGVMRLDQGATKNYSESALKTELAILDTTDPKFDSVVAIPESALQAMGTLQHPALPFTVRTVLYFPNSVLQMRSRIPNAAPSPADQGFGPELVALPEKITYKPDEQNTPTVFVELTGAEGRIGTWLVSTLLVEPQTFSYQGRSWSLALRPTRYYQPFSISLIKFSHDRYAGTDIPKNFSSRVRLRSEDGRVDREVLIYMNNPLRYGGLTFYQAGFENNDRTSILQVVRNPSWAMPYASCALIALGLVIQFGIHLAGFFRKRAAAAAAIP